MKEEGPGQSRPHYVQNRCIRTFTRKLCNIIINMQLTIRPQLASKWGRKTIHQCWLCDFGFFFTGYHSTFSNPEMDSPINFNTSQLGSWFCFIFSLLYLLSFQEWLYQDAVKVMAIKCIHMGGIRFCIRMKAESFPMEVGGKLPIVREMSPFLRGQREGDRGRNLLMGARKETRSPPLNQTRPDHFNLVYHPLIYEFAS